MATPRERLAQLRQRERLEELRAMEAQESQPTQETPDLLGSVEDVGRQIKGFGEAAASLVAAPFAQAASGAAGALETLTSGGLAGAELQADLQQQLTPDLSAEGQAAMGSIGSGLEAIAEIPGIDAIIEKSKSAGDFITKIGETAGRLLADPVATITGKDTERSQLGEALGGSLGQALPQTAAEVLGVRASLAPIVKGAGRLPSAPKPAGADLSGKNVDKILKQVAPDVQEIANTASSLYQRIDASGMVIKGRFTQNLANNINDTLKKAGFNRRQHAPIVGVIEELGELSGKATTVTRLRQARRVAQSAGKSGDPDTARLSGIVVDKIDDAIESLGPKNVVGKFDKNISTDLRKANALWRRKKKIDTVDEALFLAGQDASFEVGIRNRFNSLLKNKRARKIFTMDKREDNHTIILMLIIIAVVLIAA